LAVLNGWQIKSALAALASMLCWAIGGWDALAQALVALIALDVAAGLARAFVERRLNSSVMRRGLIRKSCYFLAIILAVLVDRSVFDGSPAARTLTLSYLCINEALPVIEHLAAVGVPLPAQLQQALERVRKELDSPHEPDDRPA
jgi:toxin secretion/phage lysis holin